jgi:hypothetical protein
MYILACCQLFATLYNWIADGIKKEGSLKSFVFDRRKRIAIAALVFGVISVPFIFDKYFMRPQNFTANLFKPFYDLRSGINPEPAYLYVKKHAQKNDIIVQTTLEYGYFFLGDGYNFKYLRQKKTGRDADGNRLYTTFNKNKEPYYGRPLIDDLEKLKILMANSQSKIWLILGEKSEWAVGLKVKKLIRDHFHLHFQKNEFRVYSFSN